MKIKEIKSRVNIVEKHQNEYKKTIKQLKKRWGANWTTEVQEVTKNRYAR